MPKTLDPDKQNSVNLSPIVDPSTWLKIKYVLSRTVLTSFTQPIYRIRVKQQHEVLNFRPAFWDIIRTEGMINGMWKGNVISSLREGWKATYKSKALAEGRKYSNNFSNYISPNRPLPEWLKDIFVGIGIGAGDATLGMAFEAPKVKKITSKEKTSFWTYLRSQYNANPNASALRKFKSVTDIFTRGYVPTVLKQSTTYSILFVVQGGVKKILKPWEKENKTAIAVTATGTSTVAAAVASVGPDCVKTVMQADGKTFGQAIEHIVKNGGATAVKKGLGTQLVLNFVGMGVAAGYVWIAEDKEKDKKNEKAPAILTAQENHNQKDIKLVDHSSVDNLSADMEKMSISNKPSSKM